MPGMTNLPDDVGWYPLTGVPLVRRTWAVWPASSRLHDTAVFVDALQPPAGLA
jgi:hypothetical protein